VLRKKKAKTKSLEMSNSSITGICEMKNILKQEISLDSLAITVTWDGSVIAEMENFLKYQNIIQLKLFCLFYQQSELSTFFKLMFWVRHCPPMPIVS
jgi:hypothetical protein